MLLEILFLVAGDLRGGNILMLWLLSYPLIRTQRFLTSRLRKLLLLLLPALATRKLYLDLIHALSLIRRHLQSLLRRYRGLWRQIRDFYNVLIPCLRINLLLLLLLLWDCLWIWWWVVVTRSVVAVGVLLGVSWEFLGFYLDLLLLWLW
jgi:hypothetical protein